MAEEREVSEAQIAVHWREEEYYQPSAKFIAQANAADPAIFEQFSEEPLPGLLQGVRRPARLGSSTGTRPWTRATRRSGSGSSAAVSTPATTASTGTWQLEPQQGRPDLGPRAGNRTTPRRSRYQELYNAG